MIQYIHSEQAAKIQAYGNSGGISTRQAYAKDEEGRDLSAFYQLKPQLDEGQKKFDSQYVELYRETTKSSSLEVLNGNKTVEQALEEIGGIL